jgi:hypothetical protein
VSAAPSVAPSSTSSPSPTELPPLTQEEILAAIPLAAQREDFIGASEFAKFFLELYPEMFLPDADTRLFSSLSDVSDCAFCASALESANETFEAGARSEGGEFAWEYELAIGGQSDNGFWYAKHAFAVSDTRTFDTDGVEVAVSKGGTGDVAVKLSFDGHHWRVHGVEFVFDDE